MKCERLLKGTIYLLDWISKSEEEEGTEEEKT